MFHQVVVAEEHSCSQRFLWRDVDSGPLEVYEMIVKTFGAGCSPCIAYYMKEANAAKYRDSFPRAVKSILDHHYVDDLLVSFHSTSKVANCHTKIVKYIKLLILKGAIKFVLKPHCVKFDVINGKRCPTKRELLCVVISIFDLVSFCAIL